MESPILDIATSMNHPHILAACADGSVGCANVVRRIFSARKVQGLHHRMTWFRYEHRDALPKEPNVAIEESSDQLSNPDHEVEPTLRPDQALSKPMGRFIEGFKMKAVSLASESFANSTKDGKTLSVVYGLSNGITRVSWNPNLKCGAWAAAATATGLVRIEDLAAD